MNIYLLFLIIICSQIIKYTIVYFNNEMHNKMKRFYNQKVNIFTHFIEILLFNVFCLIIQQIMIFTYKYDEIIFLTILLFLDITLKLTIIDHLLILNNKYNYLFYILYNIFLVVYDHYIYSYLLSFNNFIVITLLHFFIKIFEEYCIRIIYKFPVFIDYFL
jgi:hypothetical protein